MKNMISKNKKFDIFMQKEEHSDHGIICTSHTINTDYHKLLLKIIKLIRFKYDNIEFKNGKLDELLYSERIYINPENKNIMLNAIINLYDYTHLYYHGESLHVLLMYLFPYVTQLYPYLNMVSKSSSYYKSITNINELEYQEFESNKKKPIDSIDVLGINLLCDEELFNFVKKNENYNINVNY